MAKVEKTVCRRNQAYHKLTSNNVGSLSIPLKDGKKVRRVRGIMGFIGKNHDLTLGSFCFESKKGALEGIYFKIRRIDTQLQNGKTQTTYQLDLDLTDSTMTQPKAEKFVKSFIRKVTTVGHERMVSKILEDEGKSFPPCLRAGPVGEQGLKNYDQDRGILFTDEFIKTAITLRINYVRPKPQKV